MSENYRQAIKMHGIKLDILTEQCSSEVAKAPVPKLKNYSANLKESMWVKCGRFITFGTKLKRAQLDLRNISNYSNKAGYNSSRRP